MCVRGAGAPAAAADVVVDQGPRAASMARGPWRLRPPRRRCRRWCEERPGDRADPRVPLRTPRHATPSSTDPRDPWVGRTPQGLCALDDVTRGTQVALACHLFELGSSAIRTGRTTCR